MIPNHIQSLTDRIAAAITTLVTTPGIKRVDGEDFKAYWAGTVLRVDIDYKE